MNPNLLKQIADEHYKLADLFTQLAADTPASVSAGGPAAGSPAPAAFEPSPFDPIPDEFQDEGSEAMCPKHRQPFKDGNYGPFCTSTTDDPAWSNRKGYCTITPKNAAQYLRVRAAA